MFMLTLGNGMNTGFPDVCLTPQPLPTPVPYPNVQLTATTTSAVNHVLVDAMPALNQLSRGLVSTGDEPGVLLGVISHLVTGPCTYVRGCSTILVGGAPAQRLSSLTGQNCQGALANVSGVCTAPSQSTVLTLG